MSQILALDEIEQNMNTLGLNTQLEDIIMRTLLSNLTDSDMLDWVEDIAGLASVTAMGWVAINWLPLAEAFIAG